MCELVGGVILRRSNNSITPAYNLHCGPPTNYLVANLLSLVTVAVSQTLLEPNGYFIDLPVAERALGL